MAERAARQVGKTLLPAPPDSLVKTWYRGTAGSVVKRGTGTASMLVKVGIEPSPQGRREAGDWQAPTMPAHYARHQHAAPSPSSATGIAPVAAPPGPPGARPRHS